MAKQSLSIFNFSKFVLQVFLIVALVGYTLDFLFEKYIIFGNTIGGASKVHRIIASNNADEIPILGSSRAEGSFVPSILFDTPSFNYGIPGTHANIWLFFLEQELKKDKHTPIVINLDFEGIIYSDGDMGNYIPDYASTHHILQSQGSFYYYIPFVRYFGKLESYARAYLNEKLNLTKVTNQGGSFDKNKLTKKKFDELVTKRTHTSTTFTLEKPLVAKLEKLIASTQRPLFFVVAPYHKSYFTKFQNIHQVDEFLQKLQDYSHISVIDCRNMMPHQDSLYHNTTHLNYQGAVLFSQKLKKHIQVMLSPMR